MNVKLSWVFEKCCIDYLANIGTPSLKIPGYVTLLSCIGRALIFSLEFQVSMILHRDWHKSKFSKAIWPLQLKISWGSLFAFLYIFHTAGIEIIHNFQGSFWAFGLKTFGALTPGWGVTQVWFLVCRDVPSWNLKVDPYKNKFFKKSDLFIYQSTQFWAKFRAKSPDFSKICLNLSQFWLKFGKILKNWPIYIPNFAFYKGSFIYQEADFATHVGSTSP